VDILAEWGDGEGHHQQQRYFQLVMCFVNMLVILGFSFVRGPAAATPSLFPRHPQAVVVEARARA
jgi:hypothetical protein